MKKSKKLTLLLILVFEIQCLYYQLNVVSATLKGSLLVEDKKIIIIITIIIIFTSIAFICQF